MYTRIVEDGRISTGDDRQLRALAHRLIERENLDAIVLAGTDLSFVFNEGNTDFPHVDGVRVHIRAIMDELVAAPGDLRRPVSGRQTRMTLSSDADRAS